MIRAQRRKFAGLMFAAVVSTSSYVLAAGSTDENIIRKQYAIYAQAFRDKNAARIIALEASDYALSRKSGRVTKKAAWDAGLKKLFRVITSVETAQMKVRSIAVKSKSAVVTSEMSVSVYLANPQGQPHHMTETTVSRDTWVKTRQGWRMRRSQTLSDEATLNGQPVTTS